MKTPARLPCPRCRMKALRSVFATQMTDPDSPEAYDGYELKFRLVCKRCGFAAYSVPLAKTALLNKAWNEAVLDYSKGIYVLPAVQNDWLTVKRSYQHHPSNRPRASASRDCGQSPDNQDLAQPSIGDINIEHNDTDIGKTMTTTQKCATYGMHIKT